MTRKRLLDAVQGRIHRYAAGDHSALLVPEALEEVGALLAVCPPALSEDLVLARAAGLLLWYRSRHIGEEEDNDLIPALALLGPVWSSDPLQVPAELDEFFSDVGPAVAKPTDAWHGPALALADQVRRTGDGAAAATVVDLLHRVVAHTPPGDSEHGQCLANLAIALHKKFELAGSVADLDDAIQAGRHALDAFPATDPRRLVPLTALAVALRQRFGAQGSSDDLDEAIALGRRSVDATPPGEPVWADRLSNLGVALHYRFEWAGNHCDAAEAISAHRRAVAATDPGYPQRATRLTNLAAVLHAHFEATGRIADLDEAIEAMQQAVLIAATGDRTRVATQVNLCNSLRARFRYTGRSADLDEAVRAGEAAAELLPAGHPDLPLALSNLGLARHARFQRRRSAHDLDQAITDLRHAVTVTPAGDPDLPGRLSNLTDALLSRAEHAGDAAPRNQKADLDEAIAAGRQAVAVAERHPRRALFLSNLGNALLTRFELAPRTADLDEAIAVGEQAVDSCPADVPHLAACLANLAVSLHTRSEAHSGASADLDRAVTATRQAARTSSGSTAVRVRAAARWGHWSASIADWDEATAGMAQAVRLLERVAPRDLARGDQEFELARLGGLGSDAAACALNAGDAEAAVRLLEQGRGIVLSHALRNPDTTQRPAIPLSDQLSMITLAHAGPIVMINVSRFRSDALLLTSEGVLVQPLPRLSPSTVRSAVESFLVAVETRSLPDATPAETDRAEEVLRDTLAWLWDSVTEPVLERLEITCPPRHSQRWPRMWWCPAGLLSLLPLHAAGHHDRTSRHNPATVLDRVVSSVTPTLRALVHARKSPPRSTPDSRPEKLLVVANSDTPDQAPLPAASAEEQLLRELFPGAVTLLLGAQATRQAVLGATSAHSRIHIASHALADVINPSESHILLADPVQSRLTAADISQLHLPHAELAFLSACETARTGPALTDEAVHLASALHVAGYRHVIATLWPVADRPAMRLSRTVYTDLAEHNDLTRLPGAVHAAVRQLRDRYPNHPFAWAAHIHIGP